MTPERIKAIRKALGERQAEFAKRIGVSVATIKHWETGYPVPLMACKFLERLEIEAKQLQQAS